MSKAIIFDLFETLVTEWVSEKYTKRKVASDLGVNYDIFQKTLENFHDDMYVGKCSYETAISESCKSCGKELGSQELCMVMKKRIETKSMCFQYQHTDIIKMLNDLKSRGYKLGLISNCSSEEVTVFKNSKLYSFFDEIVLSYEVGLAKPDIAIYSLCIGKLNVKPSECIFIGDGGSCELWGAQSAGMKPLRAMWFLNQYAKEIHDMPFEGLSTPQDVMKYL